MTLAHRVLFIACSVLLAASAQGQSLSPCNAATSDWALACAKAEKLEVERVRCPDGIIVVTLAVGDGTLDVEITAAHESSFRKAGSLGLKPVGSFADWKSEPPALRNGLEALVRCAERDSSLELRKKPRPREAGPQSGNSLPAPAALRVPWLLLSGTAAGLGLFVWYARRLRRDGWIRLAGVVALGVVIAGLRWALVPHGFFHMNGQGPNWVAGTLLRVAGADFYGTGFSEVFGAVARAGGTDPDGAIFAANAALGALSVPLAYFLARAAGGPVSLAVVLAAAVGADPVLARVTQSESYYGIDGSLLMGATAVLVAGTHGTNWTTPRFWVGVAGAGALAAQASTIHPTAWVPVALTPGALLCVGGGFRRRVRTFAVATAALGALVLAGSFPTVSKVLAGTAGSQWVGIHAGMEFVGGALGDPRAWLLLGLPLALAAALRRRSALQMAVVLVVVAFGIGWWNVLTGHGEWPQGAYYRQVLGPVVCAVGAFVARISFARPRMVRWAFAPVAIVWGLVVADDYRIVGWRPADIEEAGAARQWRGTLERGSVVVYLGRVERRGTVLPIYGTSDGLDVLTLSASEPIPDLSRLNRPLYYYRSTLCSIDRGDDYCRQLERTIELEPRFEATYSAIPSSPRIEYPVDRISVSLGRIARVRPRP